MRPTVAGARIPRSFHSLNTQFYCTRKPCIPSAYAIQSRVEQVRCLTILNIIYVLFVFGSGDQTTFSLNTGAILRRQQGLYIVNALPRWEGGISRGTQHEFGG